MTHKELPGLLLRFIYDRIDSIEQLRVLLLFYSDPSRIWTTEEITAELRSSDASIAKRLDDLYSRKVLVRAPELNGKHKFTPSSDEIRTAIGELARENEIRPYRVIDAIYSRPSKALQEFSDAFKFRGDKT